MILPKKLGDTMKTIKNILAGALVAATGVMSQSVFAGGSIDLSLSDDTVRMEYDATKAGSGLHVSLVGQHHADLGDMAAVGLHVVDVRNANSDLYIGVGGKMYVYNAKLEKGDVYKKEDNHTGGALGIGGFLRYNIPQTDGLSVATYLYYAPEVVSFNSTEGLTDFDLRVQYAIIPTARVYAGYRYNHVNLVESKSDSNVDSAELAQGLHAGLKIDF